MADFASVVEIDMCTC